MSDQSTLETLEDFKSFIMLCAASSDYNISEEEHQFILQTIPENRYKSLKRIVDRCSDFECIGIIADNKDKFLPDQESKNKLMDEMQALFHSDHNYSTLERNMFIALKRIL